MGSVLRQAFALKKKLNKDGLLLQSILAVTDHLELYVTKHGEPLRWTFVFRSSRRHVRLKTCRSARHFIFKMIAFSKTLWATIHSLLGRQMQDCITVQRQRLSTPLRITTQWLKQPVLPRISLTVTFATCSCTFFLNSLIVIFSVPNDVCTPTSWKHNGW